MSARVDVECIYYAGCADCAEGWEGSGAEDDAAAWADAHNADYHQDDE